MINLNVSVTLLMLAPIFFMFFLFEMYYYLKNNKYYNFKDTLTNISLALLYQSSDIIFTLLIVKTVYVYFYLHGFKLFSSISISNILILFLLQDFLYYIFHYSSHKVRWLWASHVTHHSSINLNFSTAFRQSMTYPISGMWLFWIPLAYIGFNVDLVLLVVSLNLAFQFFIHTEIINKLGFIEYIFNTPSHHRVHHGVNNEYLDKNFAGIFIFWDKIFGTFVTEQDKVKYGITRPINTYNPIILTFHEWIEMFKDVFKNKDIRHFYKSPDWKNDKVL